MTTGYTPAGAYLDEATRAPARAEYHTRIMAAEDLRAIREQWGDLLYAIDVQPADEWPPRDSRAYINDHGLKPDPEPVIGRMPLILREHPAPVNLDALDAAMSVERNLFELADRIAEQAQRPVRRRHVVDTLDGAGTRGRFEDDQDDRDDPARWHLPTHNASVTARAASPGSRAYGLHWAAVWIEGRILGEQHGDMFTPVPLRTLDEAAATIRRARATVDRALNRDRRTITLTAPCPWCGGTLTGRTVPGGEPYVTCDRGEPCPAPVILDGRRRTWRGADLVELWAAMRAARARSEETAA
ncbi:hypothetical protein [Streptomyces sp. NPDC091046]|uniref:hypothetical protein n=1 Tax=Streptomyces sp. NPDC091046 TaxID=3365973 RepID=UPI003806DAC4